MLIKANKNKERIQEVNRVNKKKERIKLNVWCWIFMLPTVSLYIAFQGIPILSSIFYSTLDWSGMSSSATFIGLANFKELFQDELFINAIANSFKYMLMAVPVQLVLSLSLAYILNSVGLKGTSFYRTLFFLPVITTASIVGIIMVFVFGTMGPVNAVLMAFGLDRPINFLGSSTSALFTVMLIGVWKDVGIYMIYWIAALQSVPQDVYEAAAIDGAGKGRIFFSIVVPIIMPIGIVITTLCTINSLKVFDIVQTMTEGGPFFATDVAATFVYRTAYSSSIGMPRLGYASAAAMIFGLLVVSIGVILASIKKIMNKKKYI